MKWMKQMKLPSQRCLLIETWSERCLRQVMPCHAEIPHIGEDTRAQAKSHLWKATPAQNPSLRKQPQPPANWLDKHKHFASTNTFTIIFVDFPMLDKLGSINPALLPFRLTPCTCFQGNHGHRGLPSDHPYKACPAMRPSPWPELGWRLHLGRDWWQKGKPGKRKSGGKSGKTAELKGNGSQRLEETSTMFIEGHRTWLCQTQNISQRGRVLSVWWSPNLIYSWSRSWDTDVKRKTRRGTNTTNDTLPKAWCNQKISFANPPSGISALACPALNFTILESIRKTSNAQNPVSFLHTGWFKGVLVIDLSKLQPFILGSANPCTTQPTGWWNSAPFLSLCLYTKPLYFRSPFSSSWSYRAFGQSRHEGNNTNLTAGAGLTLSISSVGVHEFTSLPPGALLYWSY